MKKIQKYYDIRDDMAQYPDAWCYIVWSKRGPGKTYSTLRMCIEDDKKFIFMKRTIEDVNLMCARMEDDPDSDVSPFKPLNNDLGWDIYPFLINNKGMAGFYHTEIGEDGKLHPVGKLLGWIIAVSAVAKFKGFSMSEADYLIFDEFIPKPYERVNRTEGDAVLDLYMTVSRDRVKRGRPELKLILLANATSIRNPMFDTMEITDIAAHMDIIGEEYEYLDDGTMLHAIPSSFDIDDETEKTGIEKRMDGTAWASMAFGGKFGYDDFTNIGKVSLKGYRPICSLKFKRSTYYLYNKEGEWYMCRSAQHTPVQYNLNLENDQKLFFANHIIELREACITGHMRFELYTMYDLIINYRKNFKI